MDEPQHLLERNGRYQLLARVRDPMHADGVASYVVTNLAGDVIGEEPTLAMARARMARLVEPDPQSQPTQGAPLQRTRPPRR